MAGLLAMPIVLLTEQERLGSTVAGRYRLDTVLGTGGMAVVFKAKHTWTGRDVAVKFLDPRKTKDVETASKRFLKEGRVIGALSHPNVVKVLDMGKDENGIVFQVLELLHGHTLASRLDQDVRLTAQEMLDSLVPIMDALTAAHEMGIIHRDLKPENIFISADESGRSVPMLLDFGVAKGLDDAGERNLTREGSVLGTPYYMAPEQATGASSVGPAADVYSLGTVMFECLVGDLPFGDREPADYAVELLSAKIPKLRERAPGVDEEIAAVVDRALVRDPAERWASMLEFRNALARAAKEAALSVPPPAVFTPEARVALLAMRDDESVVTLGEGTMLSDLTSGRTRPGARRRGIMWIAAASIVAAGVTFALVQSREPEVEPALDLVGSEPTTASVALPEEEASAIEPQGSDATEDPIVDLEEEDTGAEIVGRLQVKRIAVPRELTQPRMAMRGRMNIPEETVDAAAIAEESPGETMGRGRPNVVREF
jgi:serine/threonine-protein kinase